MRKLPVFKYSEDIVVP